MGEGTAPTMGLAAQAHFSATWGIATAAFGGLAMTMRMLLRPNAERRFNDEGSMTNPQCGPCCLPAVSSVLEGIAPPCLPSGIIGERGRVGWGRLV